MTTDFERAHSFTAQWEGGYIDHPSDPGGETNLGVTKAVWENWCRAQGITPKPMRALTLADVLPLYQARYWAPAAAQLPWPLSAVAYDIAVNHGPGNLTRLLVQAKGQGPLDRALSLVDAREAFYRAIVAARPSQGVFLRGWMNRVNAQRAWLKANATATQEPAVKLIPPGGGKEVTWDGQKAVYGGVTLTPDLITQLRTVYPLPGGPWTYQGIRIWRRQNGDLVLERL